MKIDIEVPESEIGHGREATVGKQMHFGRHALGRRVGPLLAGLLVGGSTHFVLRGADRIGQAVGQAEGLVDARGALRLFDAGDGPVQQGTLISIRLQNLGS